MSADNDALKRSNILYTREAKKRKKVVPVTQGPAECDSDSEVAALSGKKLYASSLNTERMVVRASSCSEKNGPLLAKHVLDRMKPASDKAKQDPSATQQPPFLYSPRASKRSALAFIWGQIGAIAEGLGGGGDFALVARRARIVLLQLPQSREQRRGRGIHYWT